MLKQLDRSKFDSSDGTLCADATSDLRVRIEAGNQTANRRACRSAAEQAEQADDDPTGLRPSAVKKQKPTRSCKRARTIKTSKSGEIMTHINVRRDNHDAGDAEYPHRFFAF
ncbi:hypothetical protein DIPPA_02942 [Diplonema papillatum]|nr:hypothetical protein DIPPA_02942 [Diplonema papillatum]